MVSVRYPQFPGTVDAGAIMDAFDSGFDRSRAERDDRLANEAFGQYVGTLYGKQPQTLASLGNMVSPQQAPQGAIARAPLSPPMDPATARVDAAFAAQGQGRNSLSGNQIAGRFLKSVRDGGVTNPYALAAIAATGKRESGFSPQNAAGTWSDPSQSGQAGTAGGIMSWRGDRLSALQQFAQQRGDNPNAPSPETQGAFLIAEDPSLIQKLQAAQSPQEAQTLMNNAWKFAGYNQQGGETAARMALAQEYAPQFGGNGPSQAALESMAVGQTLPAGAPQAAPQVASADATAIPVADPSSLLPPREVMLALFKSKGTRQFAMGLAQSAQELRMNAADPVARLKYQTALAQLAKAQKGEADKYGNSVIWGQDESGNWVALQPSSGGGLIQAQTPKGVKLSPPGVSNLNLGTEFGIRDRNGTITNRVAIDNTGKAEDTKIGAARGEARADYESMVSKMPGLETVVSDLDKLAAKATYTTGGRVWDTARKEMGAEPREAAVARTQYIATVSNQILPLLRDTFGAQFTAKEGETLVATLGDPNVTPAEKQAVLKTFIEQKRRDVEALGRRTSQPGAAAPQEKSDPLGIR